MEKAVGSPSDNDRGWRGAGGLLSYVQYREIM